ncbi:MAG: helix-turn-helix transcriptional regulator [Acidobacteriota bacterium]
MAQQLTKTGAEGSFGALLRQWRIARRLSQLDLSLEADVSSKHVSFLETGRSQPSREMVLRLSEVLHVPVRQRNTLLRAAGFAPFYTESDWNDPHLAEVRRSVERLIEQHNPYPAIVCDQCFNVHLQNRASGVLMAHTLGPEAAVALADAERVNMAELLFHPQGFRPAIANWPEVGAAMIQRLHREAATSSDPEVQDLLERVLRYKEVPPEWRFSDLESELKVIVPLHIRTEALDLRFFTAITTLGTALDVTLRELVIETFLPADDETEASLRKMMEEAAE